MEITKLLAARAGAWSWVADAEYLPDMIVVGTVGFLNECSRAARPEGAVRWSVEWPRPDLVVYRMDRSYD